MPIGIARFFNTKNMLKEKKEKIAKKMKKGFDSQKRWGNSAMKGHGANSPAMMKAREEFKDKK